MKKFLAVLLALSLLPTLMLSAAAEDAVISVASRKDLEDMKNHPGASFRLDADIDLGDNPWIPIPFSGTLDGGGHTVYNLTVNETGKETAVTLDGNHKPYDTVFAGLFSTVKDSQIRNLNILGSEIKIETDQHCFTGLLSGYMEHSLIENCTAEGRSELYTTNVMVGISGLIGYGTGKIENCRTNTELTFADRSDRSRNIRCEQFMAGLLACGNASLLHNTVEIMGYDSCWGFVHNGGLVGMHYWFDGKDENAQIIGNKVSGQITFFENNPMRRAYCDAFGGELLTPPFKMMDNSQEFTRNELFDQTEEIKPHACKSPEFEETVSPHSDDAWGYTLHQCKTCDYQYKDHYIAPGHVPGDWEIITEASYETEGLRQQVCTVCKEVIAQEVIPKKTQKPSCTLSEEEVTIHYKDTFVLKASVTPEEEDQKALMWISSNPDIVSVDAGGRLTALQWGDAIITCVTDDGTAQDSCLVSVNYSPLQWVIEILLFGWIWY